jgi:hypothetical protein
MNMRTALYMLDALDPVHGGVGRVMDAHSIMAMATMK